LKITGGIPANVARVQEEEQHAREQVAVAKRRKDQAAFGAAIATAASGMFAASIVIVGGAFPPALLILPVVLPIFGVISSAVSLHYSRQVDRKFHGLNLCFFLLDAHVI
jgi:hypothetical protein